MQLLPCYTLFRMKSIYPGSFWNACAGLGRQSFDEDAKGRSQDAGGAAFCCIMDLRVICMACQTVDLRGCGSMAYQCYNTIVTMLSK